MKKLVFSMMCVLAIAGMASAAAVGNPNAGNGWSSASGILEVTSSGYQYTLSPNHAIDGSGLDAATGTMHNNDLWDFYWDAPWQGGVNNPHPGTVASTNWIAFKFDQAYPLTTMHVWNYNYGSVFNCGSGAKDVAVQYSLTGGPMQAEWTTVPSVPVAMGTAQNDFLGNDVADFGGAMAQYVCISILSDWGSPYGDQGIAEFRFNYVPEPATMLLLGLGGLAIRRRRA